MIIVTTEAELLAAIAGLETEIVVANDIHLTTRININYETKISGQGNVSLFWDNPTPSFNTLFVINETGDLTMENITIDLEGRNGTPINILGGRFVMNSGVTIKNIVSTSSQGAIRIGVLGTTLVGTFIMNGGLITNIESSTAIMNYSGKIFMNNDAKISFNKAGGINMSNSTDKPRPQLVMSDKAEISDNTARLAAGGGITISADIIMGVKEGDAPSVSRNSSLDYYVGGWNLTSESTLTMRYDSHMSYNSGAIGGAIGAASGSRVELFDNATINNNSSLVNSGGGYVSGGFITLHDNSKFVDNSCVLEGGGLRLIGTSVAELKDSSVISGNSAEIGGGVHIALDSTLNVLDNAKIENNIADLGKGIYKVGSLNLADSVNILDGLHYTDSNVASIIRGLSSNARVLLESSDFVKIDNIPLVIALKDDAITALVENDRKAFVIPNEFGEGYGTILMDDKTAVLIDLNVFSISYENLNGSTHTNPTSYTINDLPIVLIDPTRRVGFKFLGWFDKVGNKLTQIDEGTIGDVTLFARWERLYLGFNPNGCCVCNMPQNMWVDSDEMTIPDTIPCKRCHKFICWNIPDSSSGKVFFPNDKITITDASIVLSAQWMEC